MLQLSLALKAIDYEKTVHGLLPFVVGRLKAKDPDGLPVMLLDELGNDGEELAVGLLKTFPEVLLQDTVCQVSESYKNLITDKVNGILHTNELGRSVTVGSVAVEKRDGKLCLCARNVEADIQSILSSPTLQTKIKNTVSQYAGGGILGKMAAKAVEPVLNAISNMMPEKAESSGAELLKRPELKEKLLGFVTKKLTEKGIFASLGDLSVEAGTTRVPIDTTPDRLRLTPELKRALVKTVSQYLKSLNR